MDGHALEEDGGGRLVVDVLGKPHATLCWHQPAFRIGAEDALIYDALADREPVDTLADLFDDARAL
jgi:hypothetical protein